MLDCSDYLKEKYSQPIYGAEGGIQSENFEGKAWIEHGCGRCREGSLQGPGLGCSRIFRQVSKG